MAYKIKKQQKNLGTLSSERYLLLNHLLLCMIKFKENIPLAPILIFVIHALTLHSRIQM